MMLWNYARRGWAERAWAQWYTWAIRSRLPPIKRVAKMIQECWAGVMNAVANGSPRANVRLWRFMLPSQPESPLKTPINTPDEKRMNK